MVPWYILLCVNLKTYVGDGDLPHGEVKLQTMGIFLIIFLANSHLYTILTSGGLSIKTIADNGHVALVRVNEFQPELAQKSSKPYIEPAPGHTARVSTAL